MIVRLCSACNTICLPEKISTLNQFLTSIRRKSQINNDSLVRSISKYDIYLISIMCYDW